MANKRANRAHRGLKAAAKLGAAAAAADKAEKAKMDALLDSVGLSRGQLATADPAALMRPRA